MYNNSASHVTTNYSTHIIINPAGTHLATLDTSPKIRSVGIRVMNPAISNTEITDDIMHDLKH